MKNVLFVGAHPDDLEMMAGGLVNRIVCEGGNVHAITLTDGTWAGADGVVHRNNNNYLEEVENAAKILGYSYEHLNEKTFNIRYKDEIVVKILKRINDLSIDTIICPWIKDLHIDHQMAARMAISASKNINKVLMGQINWYIGDDMFKPNIYFDITDQYKSKIEALRCYKSEMKRTGDKWESYQEALTNYYGLISGVPRAEGFITKKFTL